MNRHATGTKPHYLLFLILLSGMGGLLAGIDFGIIAGALLYLDKTIPMTAAQQGFMVAIYTFGGLIAALFAGALADLLGRKKMMLAGGLMFVASILLIFISDTYYPLLTGRILMGLSGGVVCVVVPLFMAECLPTAFRGRGTSAFQLLLTLGLVLATVVSKYFADIHDQAVAAAIGNADLIFKADQAAWKYIFLTASVPGALFCLLALAASESPRWLFRRHREADALRILRFSCTQAEADLEISEMRERATGGQANATNPGAGAGSLFQRKYVIPFIISCVVLACTQATGIGTILQFGAKILQGAGFSENAAQGNIRLITATNCIVTFFAALLVDRLGRKILLSIGTAGIIVCLTIGGLLFYGFESKRVDVLPQITRAMSADGRSLEVKVDGATLAQLADDAAGQLTVSYKYANDSKPKVVTEFSNIGPTLRIRPPFEIVEEDMGGPAPVKSTYVKDLGTLEITHAGYAPANSTAAAALDVTEVVTKARSPDLRSLSIKVSKDLVGNMSREVKARSDAGVLKALDGGAPGTLSVTYKYAKSSETTTSVMSSTDPSILLIEPELEKKWQTADGIKQEVAKVKDMGLLTVERAKYGPIASAVTGKWVLILLCAFIGFFAFGPGVCVWLALTELMPTRIRSTGMGIAMVLNNGVAFLSALFFPIVVGSRGFHLMFFIWAGCTVVYFITATFFMPETKGKTLEEIEDYFAG